ncbi:LysM-repeat protein [unidentified eubacterium SCB49]|nr:LysM-repeat protein [unidentified eubacterium SCB49]
MKEYCLLILNTGKILVFKKGKQILHNRKDMFKKNLIIPILVLFFLSGNVFAQEKYRSHIVENGETISTISKKYNVSEKAILKLNPDAKDGVREHAVIILPNNDVIAKPGSGISFVVHKVRRKETLFSLSKEYNVSIDDIKKYNKQLYSENLRKNDRIKIPQGTTTEITKTETSADIPDAVVSSAETEKHTVKAKETVYGIARMYGITMDELITMNPGLTKDLSMGSVLNVPSKTVTGSANIDDELYSFYTVKQKEGFYRLEKNLGLSEEEIIALNPYAKDGLKEGMILKIPKSNTSVSVSGKASIVDLSTSINYRESKKIAFMLPFQLAKSTSDSLDLNEALLKKNSAMRVALDFYSGAMMATEFLKDKGISTVVDVYDTAGSESKVSSIINSNNFDDVDAVIGPLRGVTVVRAATELKKDNVPVFSPLSNRSINMTSNLFQTIPSDDLLGDRLIAYMKPLAFDKNVIIVTDNKSASDRSKLIAAFPGAIVITPKDKGYIYVADVDKQLTREKDNWVILASKNPIIVSNVVPMLNGIPGDYNIRLFTMNKNNAYESNDVSNVQLANLNFTFPSVNKSYDYKSKNAFLVSYKNKYGVLPNRFAVRGFDVTYDVLLRLANEEDVYKASDDDFMTEYVENRFRYEKKMFSGYENKAIYILKYTDKLEFEVLE